MNMLDPGRKQDYIPAAFFIHFGKDYSAGQAAIDRHLEYFRHTQMDFLKIQFENEFPAVPKINRPRDWDKMPLYHKDFYEKQLKVVEGLVKAGKKEALVIQTLYSPFMCAGHTLKHAQSGGDIEITRHLKDDPGKVKIGMEIITESVLEFVKECVKLGVDGFYACTQGGETHRFKGSSLFNEYVKPYDSIMMEEINRSCDFNILHICDYCGGYDDLSPFLDYPGQVVNSSLELGDDLLTPKEAGTMFNRPYMGGLDKLGCIVSENKNEVITGVENVLDNASDKFILGAECTLPADINWNNINTAISTAHNYKRT